MANQKVLNELIAMNNNLIHQYSAENDVHQIEKHKIIASILNDKNAFDKMDIAVALNIIADIIQNETYAFDVYKNLILTNNP